MLKRAELVRVRHNISPADLHLTLSPTATVVVTFNRELEMMRYRRLLYDINRQGKYRYRSLRDEEHMWGLIIWRMK